MGNLCVVSAAQIAPRPRNRAEGAGSDESREVPPVIDLLMREICVWLLVFYLRDEIMVRRSAFIVLSVLVSCLAGVTNADIITEYSSTVDTTAEEVTFRVLYESPPDFFADWPVTQNVLQFNIDPNKAIIPGSGSSSEGHTVLSEFRTFSTDLGPSPGVMSVFTGENDLVATVPFTVTGSLFEFTSSFSLLNDTDGDFTYSIEDGEPFTQVRRVFFGTSGQTHEADYGTQSVPEPTSLALLGSISLFVGMARYCRGRKLRLRSSSVCFLRRVLGR